MPARVRTALLLFLLSSTTSIAADGGTRFFWENDAVFGDSDRYYTNGMRFELWFPAGQVNATRPMSLFGSGLSGSSMPKKDHWFEFWKLNRPGCRSLVGFSFGQTMFTSSNIRTPVVSSADRNYAAHLYLGGMIYESCAGRDIYLELTIGALGPPAMGEQSQTLIHRLIGSPPPQGWDDQTPARLAVQSHLEYRRRMTDSAGWLLFGRAGSVYITAGAGIQYRVGRFERDSSFPGTGMSHPAAPPAPVHKTESYLFLESTAFLQFMDATLREGGDGGLDRLYDENLLRILGGTGNQLENSLIWNLLVPTSNRRETQLARYHLIQQLHLHPEFIQHPGGMALAYRLLTNTGGTMATDALLWDLVKAIRPSDDSDGASFPLRAPRTVQTLTTIGFQYNMPGGLYCQIALSTGPSDFLAENGYPTWHRWGSFQVGFRF